MHCRVCLKIKPQASFYAPRQRSIPICYECKKQLSIAEMEYGRVRFKGFTAIDFKEVFIRQNGKCAICGSKPNKRRLHIDHNHKTGKIRGLLCGRCNPALGYAQDNPDILRKMIAYLEDDK